MLAFADVLILAQDAATMACAGLNAVYFTLYLLRAPAPSRRLGAAVLTLLNLGILAEGAYFSALYAAYHFGVGPLSLLAPKPWFLARLLLSLGTVATTALVIRQWRFR